MRLLQDTLQRTRQLRVTQHGRCARGGGRGTTRAGQEAAAADAATASAAAAAAAGEDASAYAGVM